MDRETEPVVAGDDDPFVKTILCEAEVRDIDPALARSRWMMRLELA